MPRTRSLCSRRKSNHTSRTWSSKALLSLRKPILSLRTSLSTILVWKNSYRFWCLNSSLIIWMIWTSIKARLKNCTMLSVYKRMKSRRRTFRLRLTSCRSKKLRTLFLLSKKTLREELISLRDATRSLNLTCISSMVSTSFSMRDLANLKTKMKLWESMNMTLLS